MRIIKKVIILLLAAVAMLMLAVPAYAAAKTTTIMMYMCGTDLQSDCLNDIYEMCDANLDNSVNIVILAGGAKKWDDKRLNAKKLNLMSIQNGSISKVEDWGSSGMGDAATLSRFVEYCWKNIHSDRNILVLWDHGGGTAQGVCFDEVHKDDGLNLIELENVLSGMKRKYSDFHLDMLGCDACLMAGYEIAALAADYADYYVASEELEPWLGWYYTDWLNALADDPAMDTRQLCVNIVDAYAAAVKREKASEYTTLSVIDLQAFRALQADIETLSGYLQKALENGQLATVSRMLSRMYSFGSFEGASDNDMYDMSNLLDICEQFAPAVTADARQHLQQAVAYSYASSDMPVASGLSIYIPQVSRKSFMKEILAGYNLKSSIPNYIDFVTGFTAMTNGSSYTFSASAPSVQTASTVSQSAFSQNTSSFFGLIPGSTYNVETNTFGSFVAGQQSTINGIPVTIAGSAQSTQGTGSFSLSDFIAGNGQPAPTQAPGAGGFSLTSFIAGISGQTSAPASAPIVSENDLAFSLRLTEDAMENLDYVEGALFADLSDEDGYYMLDLGYMRNTWIDWMGNTVYSTFDGTWPVLDGRLIAMYDCVATEKTRRSLINVLVNGKETCLVVVFDDDSKTGRIIGHNAGLDENGLPIRRVTQLRPGDEITPLFSLLYCDWDDFKDEDTELDEIIVEGESFLWRDGMTVTYESLKDEEEESDYYFAFYLNDIFGDYEVSDFFEFTM